MIAGSMPCFKSMQLRGCRTAALTSERRKPDRAFRSKVEDAGEAKELGRRSIFAVISALLLATTAYVVGSWLWVGIGIMLALAALPAG